MVRAIGADWGAAAAAGPACWWHAQPALVCELTLPPPRPSILPHLCSPGAGGAAGGQGGARGRDARGGALALHARLPFLLPRHDARQEPVRLCVGTKQWWRCFRRCWRSAAPLPRIKHRLSLPTLSSNFHLPSSETGRCARRCTAHPSPAPPPATSTTRWVAGLERALLGCECCCACPARVGCLHAFTD